MAERHGLQKEQIIDFNGKLLPIAGEFKGMHIKKARPLIAEKLRSKGLLEKIDENYVHSIALNSRGGGIIEPQIMRQWFIDVNKKFKLKKSHIKDIKDGQDINLKELMGATISSGQIEIIPEQFKKIYFHWIDNLRDWCISRQIWYGHRIPVWYREDEVYCGVSPPRDKGWEQDNDTLDTWFSSALWTFSTLGWPAFAETATAGKPGPENDLANYHPTSILETGYDILFFWVARMILMTGYHLGDIPFERVYLHGLVRDQQGRKMSKSLGNTIDPLDMIKKYGADATRMSLIIGNPPGQDLKLSEEKIKGYKHFTNKMWNITRFVLSSIEDFDVGKQPELTIKDKEILEELSKIAEEITRDIEHYRFYLAGEKLYHYI
ncbi:MAG: class I tRNA ligase family protein, partial [Planctomycetes bacterium]|nr:class I tRNA ligase family protein [Planctomycetota bacterium]